MQDASTLENQTFAWTPTPEVIERSRLTQFMKQVGVSTWDELYEFSIRDVEKFTEEVLKFLDIKFDPPYEKLLDTSNGIESPVWFRRNADTPVRNGRNADTPVRNGRNADTPVRNEGEARTTAATFENKRGWHERGYLPHFDGVATQFITFRLADSLPQSVLREFKRQIEETGLDDASDEYREMVEQYLDAGIGSCIFRDPEVAHILQQAIEYEDGKSCKLTCWVIMPNHAHLVLRPQQGHSLSDIVKRIKGVSARKINELRGTAGPVWQPDYFDRYIRDAEHYAHTINYVENNPVRAKLCAAKEDWKYSSASPQAAIADKSVRVPTGGLNITEMCLDRWQTDEMKDQPAVIWEGEDGKVETYSYKEMLGYVDIVAAGLKRAGFRKGDAIGIHMPMIGETINVLLSINRIGAIAVPVFSGYGVEAIASRLNAVGAKALFTSESFSRRGRTVDSLSTAMDAVSHCPTIEKVYVTSCNSDEFEISKRTDDARFRSFDSFWENPQSVDAEPTSAEDPLIILYTSGTTGKPKGIAHTHASFPIKAAQDMAFGTDVGKGTRICWYTDIGWMMGPWLIYGALINGATICIYDGAPDYPTPDRMWEFCAKHKVEVLGISPTLIRSLSAHTSSPPYAVGVFDNTGTPFVPERGVAPASGDGVVLSFEEQAPHADRSESNHPVGETPPPLLRKEGSKKVPAERFDLSNLRILASTGEPWNPDPWWWLFNNVGGGGLPIINYSGGTEIAGGILMGNPLLPIKPCSFPAPCPGMDIDIFDENGKPVERGHVGELVIKQPWIGMARGFWEEKDRYLDAYWRRFEGIWVHGDWAMEDADGCWYILGRSDDTLKVAGKRVGPAEVESILVSHSDVVEAAVIGVPDEVKGTAMVAIVVRNADTDKFLAGGAGDADKSVRAPLEQELKALVAREMGKPLAPSAIHFVSALPKTRNAKVMRRVIRSAYLGDDAGDVSSLENPQTIDEIRKLNDR